MLFRSREWIQGKKEKSKVGVREKRRGGRRIQKETVQAGAREAKRRDTGPGREEQRRGERESKGWGKKVERDETRSGGGSEEKGDRARTSSAKEGSSAERRVGQECRSRRSPDH